MHWNPAVGIPLLIIGLIVLALVWAFGQPRQPGQGRRLPFAGKSPVRREPTLGADPAGEPDDASGSQASEFAGEPSQGELDVGFREELERLGATLAGERAAARARTPAGGAAPTTGARTPPRAGLGRRPHAQPVDRIVSLFVMAREDERFRGADLIVAMEKAGLEFGDMGIFHRLLDGKPELGPVFSVANVVKPGSFDMDGIVELQTPGLSLFITLPGPVPALDAWDAMLPTAQRLAELLDGQVLDEEHNALGRQRIAHIRDDLRGWDRRHEGEEVPFRR